MNGETPDPVPPLPAPPKKRGCFFYGCLTGIILMVVVLVGGFVVTKVILNKFNEVITQFTDTNSVPLPKSELSASQLKTVQDRVNAFSDAMDTHSNAPALVLTGPEVNAWLDSCLESRPKLAGYKGQFFISLEGDKANAQLSLSLDKIKFPGLHTEGRYLNGSGAFDVSVNNGMLDIRIKSMTVKSKPLPQNFLVSLQQQLQIIASGGNNNNTTNVFSQIESLIVTNSTLVIKARGN